MLKLLFLICALSSSWATDFIRPGDVLLQPLDCSVCNLIEAEEETIFSHIGVVLSVTPVVVVAEAFGKVRSVSLGQFLAKTQKGQKVRVIRSRFPALKESLWVREAELVNYFQTHFDQLMYDSEFLWFNVDSKKREKLYCSELVAKLLGAFLKLEMPLKRMHFDKNPEGWFKFFNGQVPTGEWGNSPGDFERSLDFEYLGEL